MSHFTKREVLSRKLQIKMTEEEFEVFSVMASILSRTFADALRHSFRRIFAQESPVLCIETTGGYLPQRNDKPRRAYLLSMSESDEKILAGFCEKHPELFTRWSDWKHTKNGLSVRTAAMITALGLPRRGTEFDEELDRAFHALEIAKGIKRE